MPLNNRERNSSRRERINRARIHNAVSAVALMITTGVTPASCFGIQSTSGSFNSRRVSSIKRNFRNAAVAEDTGTRSVASTFLNSNFFAAPESMEALRGDMPIWLRQPQGHLYEKKWNALRDAMMNSFFTDSEAAKLHLAIRQAANGDHHKMAGAAEFCLILVETMEMGLNALVAASYHYCSCVTARERNLLVPGASSPLESSNLNHHSLEDFGEHSIRIANDAARLKQLEMVANMVIQNSGRSQRVTPDANDCGNLMNMLLAETKDWRGLAIRSAAALYRLRGILKNAGSSDNHRLTTETGRVAREALHIYAPLASRLGMHRLKNELEGAAFRVLYRRQYETVNALAREVRSNNCDLQETLNYSGFAQETRSLVTSCTTSADIGESMKHVLNEVKEEMTQMLNNDKVFTSSVSQFSVTARVKESYSMWKKMLSNHYNHVLQVPDAVALRIVLDAKKLTEDEPKSVTRARERALCYYAQKLCIDRWNPMEGNPRFKDYVESPKSNGYQSLHYTASTNWGGEDWSLEIQVRSGEMHKVAEYGFASHWDYKAQKKGEASQSFDLDTSIPDLSMDAYLRKVQEWHWQQQHTSTHSDDSIVTPMHEIESTMISSDKAESNVRAERIRERTKQLEPYIKAFTEAQSDLARGNVFVFLSPESYEPSCSLCEGKVMSLPNGARVLDALREAEKHLGVSLPLDQEHMFSCNGDAATMTTKLQNGDVLKVPLAVQMTPC